MFPITFFKLNLYLPSCFLGFQGLFESLRGRNNPCAQQLMVRLLDDSHKQDMLEARAVEAKEEARCLGFEVFCLKHKVEELEKANGALKVKVD